MLKGEVRFRHGTNEQAGRPANTSALFIGLRSRTQTKVAILLLLVAPAVYAQSSGGSSEG